MERLYGALLACRSKHLLSLISMLAEMSKLLGARQLSLAYHVKPLPGPI